MINLAGYEIANEIHESNNSLVYRGFRKQDKQPVILKFLKQDYPTPASLVRYKQEYEIIQNLNLESVAKAYSLEKYQNSLVMVLEDCGGQSLKKFVNSHKISLEEFLTIAIKITNALGEIHLHNIIHKDINPANIIINYDTGLVQIIDFGISTVLSNENPSIKNPNVLEGTLTYISPEQTGRMNRAMDYRTDFYSLGVTFYEMLTHQLPCDYSDAMELVHCHIAKQPVPPHEINFEIPKTVSNIVIKLLAKTAEERYQSAWGIIADLKECLQQLDTKGSIADFAIAQKDISDKFKIPQKLYGREEEVANLVTAFARVASWESKEVSNPSSSQRGAEMMLVSGYSGIGKSALVQEIYKPITKARGYFISGKFDQFQRNIPYSAVVKAFQSLMRQLLTESETQLNRWKEKLLTAFAGNGQVIIDVIPEVELIVGKQPAVQELGAAESQNRFNLVFQKFISVFCSIEHPLVIFIDDLQWADSATLKLLELIMTDEETPSLFLIGAYRNNEVNPTHPLMITLDELKKQQVIINELTLTPLNIQYVTELIADTLHSNIDAVTPLAELVLSKTQGNPFFVNQFLKTLHQEKLLNFNSQQRTWHWNTANIEAIGITDNVVELMVGKLKKLPDSTQKILRLAACIGNNFDLHTLSIINQQPDATTFKELLPAIKNGLILSTYELSSTEAVITSHLVVNTYRFLHDRVQQAAYSLIDQDYKKAIHLQIGRLLLNNAIEQSEKLFEIVDHLNLGRELITQEHEQIELVKLNLVAGKKAKSSTAYQAALHYLNLAIELLPANAWESQYQLTYSLHFEKAETAYLNTSFDDVLQEFAIISQHSQNNLDLAKIYDVMIVMHTNLGEMTKAIEQGVKAVAILGIDFPNEPELIKKAIQEKIQKIQTILAKQPVENLLDLPEMVNLEKKALLAILLKCIPPAYQTNQDLMALFITTMVETSLEYGNAVVSAKAYADYALIVGGILQDYKLAYQLGQLAMNLVDKFNDVTFKGGVYFVFAFSVSHWRQPLKASLKIFKAGFQASLEGGDHIHSGYCASRFAVYSILQGEPLENVYQEASKYLHFLRKKQDITCSQIILLVTQMILGLQGKKANNSSFDGNDFNEDDFVNIFKENLMSISQFYVLKTINYYLFDHYAEAYKTLALTSDAIRGNTGSTVEVEYNFYHSLTLTALAQNGTENTECLALLENNQRQMEIWADNCPENYLHKYLLVAAEVARISGKNEEAMSLYDRAIASAKEQGFIQVEALANELAAKFWLLKGKPEFAQIYLRQAHYNYQLWGANAKVKQLEEKYPQLLLTKIESTYVKGTLTQHTTLNNRANTFTTTGSDVALDFATVMKAAGTISGEIVLSKLLARLMKIVIENAGAEKGVLILEKAGTWVIEAEGSVDSDDVTVMQSIPVNSTAIGEIPKLAETLINYVIRTQQNVVLNNATEEGQFTQDPYIAATQPKSILSIPLVHQGKLTGIVYLENNLTEGAFTIDRLEVLRLLSSQIAISIENAELYTNLQEFNQNLEKLVADRTQELSNTLKHLKTTQNKLVEAEKMASLGGLVAGVAHEINTPIGVGVTVASALAEHTSDFAATYQSGKMKRSDLQDFLDIATQSSNVLLMNLNQAAQLIQSFKQVAVDQSSEEQRVFKVRAYLDEVLLQLKPKWKATKHSIEISGDTNITLNSYPGALSQIVTNLLMNSLIHGYDSETSGKITFDFQQEGDQLRFEYADNGKGIPTESLGKIFDPFFTTKRGQGGSGLGLHLVYNLVTQTLNGEIICKSEVGVGTKFIIKLPIQIDAK